MGTSRSQPSFWFLTCVSSLPAWRYGQINCLCCCSHLSGWMPQCDYSQSVGILNSDPRMHGGNNFNSCDFCRNCSFSFFDPTILPAHLTLLLLTLSVVDHCRMQGNISMVVIVCAGKNRSPDSAKEEKLITSLFCRELNAVHSHSLLLAISIHASSILSKRNLLIFIYLNSHYMNKNYITLHYLSFYLCCSHHCVIFCCISIGWSL